MDFIYYISGKSINDQINQNIGLMNVSESSSIVTGFVVEFEDMFPYYGHLESLRS
jgi:hypothetical protein